MPSPFDRFSRGPTPEEREAQAADRAKSTTEAEEDILGEDTTSTDGGDSGGNGPPSSVSESEQQAREDAGVDSTPDAPTGGTETATEARQQQGPVTPGGDSGDDRDTGGGGGGGGGGNETQERQEARQRQQRREAEQQTQPTPEEREEQADERAESVTEAERDLGVGVGGDEGPQSVSENEQQARQREGLEETPDAPTGGTETTGEAEAATTPEGPQVDVRDTTTAPEPEHANVVQNVEQGSDQVLDQTEQAARRFEQRVLEQNPQLAAEDVAIDLDAGGPSGQGQRRFEARLTGEGRQTLETALESSLQPNERSAIRESRRGPAPDLQERRENIESVRGVGSTLPGGQEQIEGLQQNRRVETEQQSNRFADQAARAEAATEATQRRIEGATGALASEMVTTNVGGDVQTINQFRTRETPAATQAADQATLELAERARDRREAINDADQEEFGDFPIFVGAATRGGPSPASRASGPGAQRLEPQLEEASEQFQAGVGELEGAVGGGVPGAAVGGAASMFDPFRATLAAKEGVELGVEGAVQTSRGRGGEFAAEVGEAGVERVETGIEQLEESFAERPAETAARLGGSLVGTAVGIGAVSRVSPLAGRGVATVVQPGEEFASAVGTRVLRVAPGGERVLSRLPNERLDNEEIALVAGAEGARRAARAAGRGQARVRGVAGELAERTPQVRVRRDPNTGPLRVDPELRQQLSEAASPRGLRPDISVPRPSLRGVDLSRPDIDLQTPDVRGQVSAQVEQTRRQVRQSRQGAKLREARLRRDIRETVPSSGELRFAASETAGRIQETLRQVEQAGELRAARARQRARGLRRAPREAAFGVGEHIRAQRETLSNLEAPSFEGAQLRQRAALARARGRQRLAELQSAPGALRFAATERALAASERLQSLVSEPTGGTLRRARQQARLIAARTRQRGRELSRLPREAAFRAEEAVRAGRGRLDDISAPAFGGIDFDFDTRLGDFTLSIESPRTTETDTRVFDVRDIDDIRTIGEPDIETRGRTDPLDVPDIESRRGELPSGTRQEAVAIETEVEREQEGPLARETEALDTPRRPAEIDTLDPADVGEPAVGAPDTLFDDALDAPGRPAVSTDIGTERRVVTGPRDITDIGGDVRFDRAVDVALDTELETDVELGRDLAFERRGDAEREGETPRTELGFEFGRDLRQDLVLEREREFEFESETEAELEAETELFGQGRDRFPADMGAPRQRTSPFDRFFVSELAGVVEGVNGERRDASMDDLDSGGMF